MREHQHLFPLICDKQDSKGQNHTQRTAEPGCEANSSLCDLTFRKESVPRGKGALEQSYLWLAPATPELRSLDQQSLYHLVTNAKLCRAW